MEMVAQLSKPQEGEYCSSWELSCCFLYCNSLQYSTSLVRRRYVRLVNVWMTSKDLEATGSQLNRLVIYSLKKLIKTSELSNNFHSFYAILGTNLLCPTGKQLWVAHRRRTHRNYS
jgi:hypothetical protein